MDDIYVAIDVYKDSSNSLNCRESFRFITDVSLVFNHVVDGYRVFKLTALPEVIRVETKVVDTAMEGTKDSDAR